MSVNEAYEQLAQRLAQFVTGQDSLGVSGFEALDEQVRLVVRAIDGLIVERIRAARALPPAPAEEPRCT